MDNNENDKLLDHEYDGIRELDNNLPTWWLWTFFGAIIFSFIYWLHYTVSGDGPSLDEELRRGMAQIQQQRALQEKGGGDTRKASREEILALGQRVFKGNCAACHLENGGGSVGPNLTDAYWIHGPSAEAMTKVVMEGVLDKGMPPWQAILRPSEVKAVVAYIETMQNTNVKGGKAPQGEKVH